MSANAPCQLRLEEVGEESSYHHFLPFDHLLFRTQILHIWYTVAGKYIQLQKAWILQYSEIFFKISTSKREQATAIACSHVL